MQNIWYLLNSNVNNNNKDIFFAKMEAYDLWENRADMKVYGQSIYLLGKSLNTDIIVWKVETKWGLSGQRRHDTP